MLQKKRTIPFQMLILHSFRIEINDKCQDYNKANCGSKEKICQIRYLKYRNFVYSIIFSTPLESTFFVIR